MDDTLDCLSRYLLLGGGLFTDPRGRETGICKHLAESTCQVFIRFLSLHRMAFAGCKSHQSHTRINRQLLPTRSTLSCLSWLVAIYPVFSCLSVSLFPGAAEACLVPPPALICSLSGLCLYAGQSNSHDPGRSRSISTWYLVFVL